MSMKNSNYTKKREGIKRGPTSTVMFVTNIFTLRVVLKKLSLRIIWASHEIRVTQELHEKCQIRRANFIVDSIEYQISPKFLQ